MAKSLACALLVCLLAFQVEGSLEQRALTLPNFNLLDPLNAVGSLINFTKGIGDEINKVAGQAITTAEGMKTNIENFAKDAINATETEFKKVVQGVQAAIKDRLANGPIANTIKAGACAATAIGSAAAVGENTIKNSVGCITNQVNSFLTPVGDLIDKAKTALPLGIKIYQNVTGCFPNGFNVNPLDLMTNLACALGKVGPALNEVGTMITGISNDVKSLQTSFANTRNAIIVCPREQRALLVVQLGDVMTNFGKCLDAIVPDPATTATVANSS